MCVCDGGDAQVDQGLPTSGTVTCVEPSDVGQGLPDSCTVTCADGTSDRPREQQTLSGGELSGEEVKCSLELNSASEVANSVPEKVKDGELESNSVCRVENFQLAI